MGSETRSPKLRVNLVWMILGTAIYAASVWAVLVMLAKLGTPETVGYYTLGLAYTTPVVAFFGLNLRVVQATDARNEFSFATYAGQRVVATVLAWLCIAGFMMLPMHDPETRRVTLLLAVAKGVELASDILYGLYQKEERFDGIARSQILRGLTMVVAMTVVFTWSGDLQAAVLAQIACWTVVLVAHDLPFGRGLIGPTGTARPHFAWPQLRALTWTALPLGFAVFLASAYMNLPRYFIGEYAGIYEVGIFSALVYLTKIGMRIVQAVGQAIIPRLAKHFAARNFRDFSRLAFGAVTVAGMFGVVGIVLSSSVGAMLLTALYGPEYAEHGETFSIIMWAGAFSYVNWLLVNILNATRTYRAQAPLAFVTISVCFAVCVLNRDLGMSGMAWAWLIAELVQLAIVGGLVFWMVRRRFFTEMVASAD